MKKKTTTYILLVLSVGVWGTIGWKVYSTFQDETPIPVNVARATAVPEKDTLRLLLNYRDPFLGDDGSKLRKEEEPSDPPEMYEEAYVEPPPAEVLPDFQYKGIIRMGKTTQAIVSRNGESLMLKTSDKVGEFSILQITDDKLIVKRKSKKYELPIQ